MKIKPNAKIEDLPVMLKVNEIAQFWRCSPKTVYDLINTGILPAVALGRLYRVNRKYAFDPPKVELIDSDLLETENE